MPILIGDGGHARDIWATLDRKRWKQVAHHDDWDGDPDVLIGINDPVTRRAVAWQLGVDDWSWVHPRAHVGPECVIGAGTHVNYMASLTRTVIGGHCTIAPGVTICGDVTIGDSVFIGAGAVIVNLTTVPDDSFVKAGTVWTGR